MYPNSDLNRGDGDYSKGNAPKASQGADAKNVNKHEGGAVHEENAPEKKLESSKGGLESGCGFHSIVGRPRHTGVMISMADAKENTVEASQSGVKPNTQAAKNQALLKNLLSPDGAKLIYQENLGAKQESNRPALQKQRGNNQSGLNHGK
jgi:hypothetical protein